MTHCSSRFPRRLLTASQRTADEAQQTVKDLVARSGVTFDDAGERELKGVPDR